MSPDISYRNISYPTIVHYLDGVQIYIDLHNIDDNGNIMPININNMEPLLYIDINGNAQEMEFRDGMPPLYSIDDNGIHNFYW
jgi:hypothetical protein